MKPRAPRPAALAADALDAVIESVGALREQAERRVRQAASSENADQAARSVLRWLEGVGEIDPVRWLDRLRAQLPWPGTGDVSTDVDAFGLDVRYLERARPLLDFLYERWWRIAVTDAGRIPDAPRVIFVANSSGVLPWDALMLAHAVEREHAPRRRPRFLLSGHMMERPFAAPLLARLGAVRSHPENAARLLDPEGWVIAFPEGHRGALKPFRERYALAPFGRGSFVQLALRHRAALVPVAIVGAEETHPLLGRWRGAERLLGFDLPLTPTFPWLGPLGLVPFPSQWRIRFGAPLDLAAAGEDRAGDAPFVARIRDEVRSSIRKLLAEELERRNSVWS